MALLAFNTFIPRIRRATLSAQGKSHEKKKDIEVYTLFLDFSFFSIYSRASIEYISLTSEYVIFASFWLSDNIIR